MLPSKFFSSSSTTKLFSKRLISSTNSSLNKHRTFAPLPIDLPSKLKYTDKEKLPTNKEIINKGKELLSFINQSPEPKHVVSNIIKILEENSFKKYNFTSSSSSTDLSSLIKPGEKFYLSKEGSIIIISIGNKVKKGSGKKIIGAHTDSPNLKIKPCNDYNKSSNRNFIQLSVECYGGGLWETWFDRDLSLAGQVIIKENNKYIKKLINFKDSLLRIPSLCIHLRDANERESLKYNKQIHLQPILTSSIIDLLSGTSNSDSSTSTPNSTSTTSTSSQSSYWNSSRNSFLLELIAKELNCNVDDIYDFELSLYDTQEGNFGGPRKEFLQSSRLDNLSSCFVALDSFLSYTSSKYIEDDESVNVLAFFDHEEVGSLSSTGASSSFIIDSLALLNPLLLSSDSSSSNSQESKESLALKSKENSFFLSLDMAHALHPNYISKHDSNHSPLINHGLVIKYNSNQRYTTTSTSAFLMKEIARRNDGFEIPLQEFIVRNDCPCGSTIGPIVSSSLGIQAIDLGMPQLSMHSIREVQGTLDLTLTSRFLYSFLKDFNHVKNSLE